MGSSRVLKKKLHFSSKVAAVLIVLTSSIGVKALFFSSAATPKGSVTVTTYRYEGTTPVRAAGVSFKLEGVGEGQKCSGSIHHDSGNDGQVAYTDCGLADRGGDKTYKIYDIARDGYTVGKVEVNTTGRDQGNNTFLVRNNATYAPVSISVYMNKNPDPAPAPTPATVPVRTGDVTVNTCVWLEGNCNKGIGLVEIHIDSGDDNYQCPNRNKTTSTDTNRTIFQDCPVNKPDGDLLRYHVSYVKRDGYSFRSVHGTSGTDLLAGSNPDDMNNAFFHSHTAPVATNITVYMNDLTPPTGGGGTTPTPEPTHKNGMLQVTSYIYKSDGSIVRQGNVVVHVKATDNGATKYQTTDVAHNCDDYNKTTNTDGPAETKPGYGKANFVNCWTSSDGSKSYELSYISLPAGFSMRSFHISGDKFLSGADSAPTPIGQQFLIRKNVETKLEIWMNDNRAAPAPSGGTAAAAPPTVGTSIIGGTAAQSSGGTAASPTSQPAQAPGAVRQVITQTTVRYEAAGKQREPSKELAAQLNTIPAPIRVNNPQLSVLELLQVPLDIGRTDPSAGPSSDKCDPEDLPEDVDMCPALPPTPPGNLAAAQDDSGSIKVTWSASTGDEAADPILYTVERLTEGQDPQIICSELQDPDYSCVDVGTSEDGDGDESGEVTPLVYPHTYTYRVFATNGDDTSYAVGNSNPSLVDITTVPLKVNVATVNPNPNPNPGADPNGQGQSQPGSSNPTTGPEEDPDPPENPIEDPLDGPVATVEDDNTGLDVTVPLDANEEGVGCDVSEGSASSDPTLADLGEAPKGTAQFVCREQDGDVVDEFDSAVEYGIDVDSADVEDFELYAYDGDDWEEIPTDKKSDQHKGLIKYASAGRVKGATSTKFKIRSKKPLKLAVIKRKHDRTVPTAVKVAVPLTLLAAGGALIVSRRQLFPKYAGAKAIDHDLKPMEPLKPSSKAVVQPHNPVIITPEVPKKEDSHEK